MFEPREIEVSRKYLKDTIEAIEEQFVILGGWAVYFLVNDRYKETTGREYIGSRDIDIGFKLEDKDIEKSAFTRSYKILTEELGFRPQSFRLFKEIHAETQEVLESSRAKDIPYYNIIQIYVDLIVNSIPVGFREYFGFTPIDEPLLNLVFENQSNKVGIEDYGRIIYVPTPEILLATKIRSYPNRDKEHKRVKDACDIAALLLFAFGDIEIERLLDIIGSDALEKFKNALSEDEIKQVAQILALEPNIVGSAFLRLTH